MDGELTTCLLDNGAQLNFIPPAYARWQNMNVFPLECLAGRSGRCYPTYSKHRQYHGAANWLCHHEGTNTLCCGVLR